MIDIPLPHCYESEAEVIWILILENDLILDYAALAIHGGFKEYGFYDGTYNEKFLDVLRRQNCYNL